MHCWEKFIENVIKDFKQKGYRFNHIAEINIITIADKMDMSYDFYIKHNMHAVEWKQLAMINTNETLIKKRNWKQPLVKKFIRVHFLNM